MTILLLIIIYIAFISLGLPDTLLGVTWPLIHLELNVDEGLAGVIAMVVSVGTVISSLLSGRMTRKFGTGKITLISVLLTALAILGITFIPSIIWFFVLAIPLGLGAGAVDAGLNDYVARHYKSRHMSWLHCFWGIGAMVGPIIMSYYIRQTGEWRNGYMTVAILQFILVGILLISLPLWKKCSSNNVINEISDNHSSTKNSNPLKIKGVKLALISFLFYCAIEYTVGLWGSSFLINVKGIDVATAALWVSFFYGGITLGRFISGFLTMKLSNTALIRSGEIIILIGAVLLILPFSSIFAMIGFIIIGLGCAPIYPSMLHATPVRFPKENSSDIMGLQMAVAYIGGAFIPPLFGFIATRTTFILFSFVILSFIIVILLSSEILNKKLKV